MKFKDIQYKRPDLEKLYTDAISYVSNMENAETSQDFFKNFEDFSKLMDHFNEMATIAYFRHTINTNDEFYEKEQQAYDEFTPRLHEAINKLSKVRLSSIFRPEFEEKYGDTITKKDELEKDIFKPSIIEDRVKEAELQTKYQKLVASAKIDFKGQKMNISQVTAYYEDLDRDVRKDAHEKVFNWFEEHVEELDQIYDELVKLRTQIAKKLGFESYDQVAYRSMGRIGWDKTDARKYRKQIEKYIVPLVSKLYKEQAKRIGVEDMKYYDLPLTFLTGNPKPIGDEPVLVDAAQKMYRELSKETGEFFDKMVEYEIMDLTTKDGKAAGGYMEFLPETKMPLIFSNFNNTSADVDVLTHEAGHAFQGYVTRDVFPRDNALGSMEIAETHSMSMEYFTHPWMKNFFGEDIEKYYYSHVVDSLKFLPYGASIDEFQEWAYENPDVTPKERRAKYREIEKKYLPHLDYDDNKYLEEGGKWQRQLHVYLYPMYYLDYTIAQINAFQYFVWDLKDHEKAWESYLKLCSLGGRYPTVETLEKVGLKNPFEEGTMKPVVEELEKYLDTLDKSKIK